MRTAIQTLPKTPKINMRELPALAKQQIDHAQLPANYVAARVALRECVMVDECKNIADKHSAIAHYAKQIKDDSLRYYAERIHLRALMRIGDLLKKITRYTDQRREGKNAGITPALASMAVDMAGLPKQLRNEHIEKTPPSKPRKIAEIGYELSHGRKRPPAMKSRTGKKDFRSKPHTCAQLMLADLQDSIRHYAPLVCAGYDEKSLPNSATWGRNIYAPRSQKIRQLIKETTQWLQELDEAIK